MQEFSLDVMRRGNFGDRDSSHQIERLLVQTAAHNIRDFLSRADLQGGGVGE